MAGTDRIFSLFSPASNPQAEVVDLSAGDCGTNSYNTFPSSNPFRSDGDQALDPVDLNVGDLGFGVRDYYPTEGSGLRNNRRVHGDERGRWSRMYNSLAWSSAGLDGPTSGGFDTGDGVPSDGVISISGGLESASNTPGTSTNVAGNDSADTSYSHLKSPDPPGPQNTSWGANLLRGMKIGWGTVGEAGGITVPDLKDNGGTRKRGKYF